MTQSSYVHLPSRKIFEVKGLDRSSYLQGLITNDIKKVSEKASIYAALLTPQGKFLADFFIYSDSERFLLETHEIYASSLLKRLKLYKLRSKVEIEDVSNQFHVVALLDPSPSHFEDIHTPGATFQVPFGSCTVDPRHASLGLRCLLAHGREEGLVAQFLATPVSYKVYEERRIKLTVPSSEKDLEVEKSIIQEYRFQDLNALDWAKGCYVGQELMARIHYRGLIRKTLFTLALEGERPEIREEIFFNDKAVGYALSSSGKYVLAYLRIEYAKEAWEMNQPFETKKAHLRLINLNTALSLMTQESGNI